MRKHCQYERARISTRRRVQRYRKQQKVEEQKDENCG
jgi:hypothetical protein